jgi:transketolase N-terminal domain/subunit
MSVSNLPKFSPLTGAIRALAMDAVQQANSGHPGAPMGMAEIAEVLWRRHLRHNPANPHWPDRDRFIMSNGHGSMLIYALLHLTGYDLSIDDLKNFRQLHSKTPGHPEYGYTPVWKPPPAHLVRASPMRSGSRWPRRCWLQNSTVLATKSSITTPTPSLVTVA